MHYLKLATGYVASWTLYFVGDLISRFMLFVDIEQQEAEVLDEAALTRLQSCRLALVSVIYRLYNLVMVGSIYMQEWGGKGPWLVEGEV